MSFTDMPTAAPARKVLAATGGAGAGGVIVAFVLLLLREYVYAGEVPGEVVALVGLIVPAAIAYVSGYLTKRGVSEIGPPTTGRHVSTAPVSDGVAMGADDLDGE